MKEIKIGKKVITNKYPAICVPVVGKSKEEVLSQANEIVKLQPDLIELRCDIFESTDVEDVKKMLSEFKNTVGEVPILFTFRTDKEGGEKAISDDDYFRLNVEVAKTKNVELIDVEAYSKKDMAPELIKEIKECGVKVVGSNHHFEGTPEKEEIIDTLLQMEKLGADICKIAVMPKNEEDVNTLIEASVQADNKVKTPIVTMAMGELGEITRVCCAVTGSCITFAAGTNASAPGQLKYNVVRELIDSREKFHPDYNVWLIGFMGTGKTTVSQALSKITGMEVVDADEYLVKRENMAISDIFEKFGEKYFRDIESDVIKELGKTSGKIISCGGGAVLRTKNVDVMKQTGKIVLLRASAQSIYERVKDGTDRPILNGHMNVEYIEQLMKQREDKYKPVADIEVPTDKDGLVMTCHDMLSKLKK